MRDKLERLLVTLAKVQASAQIAEAKASLALEMIIRGQSTDLPEQKINPKYLCSHTLEKIEQGGDLAASIAFNSVFSFLDSYSDRKEEIHEKKSKVKKQVQELENLIHDELMALLPHS